MRGETCISLILRSAIRIFQSTPLMRGETRLFAGRPRACGFQSTPLMRGETSLTQFSPPSRDFNPLPSCEGRRSGRRFNSRHSHFNPLPSCEGRLPLDANLASQTISIHSPHARGDKFEAVFYHPVEISIHSPHARGDPEDAADLLAKIIFQSTPLMRGETRSVRLDKVNLDISIHSPHARGDAFFARSLVVPSISIHSPHARGDPLSSRFRLIVSYFNPLPSCEGRQHKLPKNPSNSRQFIQHNSFYTIS